MAKEIMVTEPMRERLQRNRQGRLTVSQWMDMITEPLAPLLLLMTPGVFLLWRFSFAWKGLLLAFVLGLILMIVPAIFRARRYARVPLNHATLYVEDSSPPWIFWKKLKMNTSDGRTLIFHKQLAPYAKLKRNKAYIVYYLEDPDSRILLSIAPADHPEVEMWQPTPSFDLRAGKRVD